MYNIYIYLLVIYTTARNTEFAGATRLHAK